MPNSITPIYEVVNREIYEGRGGLTSPKPGLNFGEFTTMEILHNGAHTSFSSLFTSVSIARTKQMSSFAEKYFGHLNVYCTRMDYNSKMFKAGREKALVLEAIKQLHRALKISLQAGNSDPSEDTASTRNFPEDPVRQLTT